MNEVSSNYYRNHYWEIHYSGLLGKFTNAYHVRIERNRKFHDRFENVLEVGGGSGEHVRFVNHQFSHYFLLDPFENIELLKKLSSDPRSEKIEFALGDARNIPFQDSHFDRVLSTCVLHHISNLENALEEIRRVSKHGAVIDFYLPCDPGMVYRWIRHLTSHLKQKNSMKLPMRRVKFLWGIEHSNHYLAIISLIKEIFASDRILIKRYPFRLASWNFNLFSVVTIQVKK